MATAIGGQAVLEGVMMRSPSSWAVAVRKPDGEIAEAMRRLYAEAKLACEPAAAAGVAAVLAGAVEGDSIVAVVSGGNVGPEIASDILAGR